MKKTITALLLAASFGASSTELTKAKTNSDIKLLADIICAELVETQRGQNFERVQILKGYGFRGDRAARLNRSILYTTQMLGDFDIQCKRETRIAIIVDPSRKDQVIDLSGTDKG